MEREKAEFAFQEGGTLGYAYGVNFSGSGRVASGAEPLAQGRSGCRCWLPVGAPRAGGLSAEGALAGRKVLEAAVGAGAQPREEAEAAVAVHGGWRVLKSRTR